MSSKHNAASRLLGVFTLATLSLATVAEAQPYGPGPGGGGMMGDGWECGYGMVTNGRPRGFGVLLLRSGSVLGHYHRLPGPRPPEFGDPELGAPIAQETVKAKGRR